MRHDDLIETFVSLLAGSDIGDGRADVALLEFLDRAPDNSAWPAVSEAEFVLGVRYLSGTGGLRRDERLARKHLADSLNPGFPPWDDDRPRVIAEARALLDDEAVLIFDQYISIA